MVDQLIDAPKRSKIEIINYISGLLPRDFNFKEEFNRFLLALDVDLLNREFNEIFESEQSPKISEERNYLGFITAYTNPHGEEFYRQGGKEFTLAIDLMYRIKLIISDSLPGNFSKILDPDEYIEKLETHISTVECIKSTLHELDESRKDYSKVLLAVCKSLAYEPALLIDFCDDYVYQLNELLNHFKADLTAEEEWYL